MTDRTVTLRSESDGRDKRTLWARIMDSGALDIEGFDSGPSTSIVSDSGSYEWHRTVKAADLPALRERLGIPPDADLLDALAADWSGERSYDLEAVLREGVVPVETFVWS